MCMPDSQLVDADPSQLAEVLHHFSAYTQLLRQFAFTPDLCNDKRTRDLFAIQETTSKDIFIVPHDTFLYRHCSRSATRLGNKEVSVLRSELDKQLGRALQERLLERAKKLDTLCRKLPAFQVCLQFSASGFCRRTRCPQAHIGVGDHNEASYNLRIRLLLQIVLINNNSVCSLEDCCERAARRA